MSALKKSANENDLASYVRATLEETGGDKITAARRIWDVAQSRHDWGIELAMLAIGQFADVNVDIGHNNPPDEEAPKIRLVQAVERPLFNPKDLQKTRERTDLRFLAESMDEIYMTMKMNDGRGIFDIYGRECYAYARDAKANLPMYFLVHEFDGDHRMKANPALLDCKTPQIWSADEVRAAFKKARDITG